MELFKKKDKQAAEPTVAEPQANVALEEAPKKKNWATMDVKDLFKSTKSKKAKDSDKDDVAADTAAPASNAPKQSLATMDVKDLIKLIQNRPNKKGNVSLKKRTMNFVHHKSNFNIMAVLPVALVLIVASSVFIKVGFLDKMDEKTRAYSELAAQQEKLAAVNAQLATFEDMTMEYGRYSYGWMTEGEIGLVNRIEILDLIEKKIAPYATVENININNNVLTMNLHGITLEQTSKMVRRLEATDMVQQARVYSASASDDGQATIFIGITLVKVANTEEGF